MVIFKCITFTHHITENMLMGISQYIFVFNTLVILFYFIFLQFQLSKYFAKTNIWHTKN